MGLRTTHPRGELLALAEGRLAGADRERVTRHLDGCAACQAEATDLARLGETLEALPAALRPLTSPSAGAWAQVWVRVKAPPLRRVVPQLNFYLSLAAVVFVLAAALPAGLGLGAQPMPVTAGVIQTPVAALVTPAAEVSTYS